MNMAGTAVLRRMERKPGLLEGRTKSRSNRPDFALFAAGNLQLFQVLIMFSADEELFWKGVEEFNAGRFFEAHDVWEELWRETPAGKRLFFQGLIQTAAGLYHLTCNNYRGACSQFVKALIKLEQYLPASHGINTQHLVERVRECLLDAELLRAGRAERFDAGRIPRIQLH